MKLPSILAFLVVCSTLWNPRQLLAQAIPTDTLAAEAGYKVVGGLTVASTTVGTAGTGYTSLPTVAFTAGSGATQATGTTTLKVVGSVTVTAGGSGYTTGDVVTITGGTHATAATFTVTASGGAVSAASITNAGVYTVPVTTTGAATTGGGGTGLTLTVGYGVGTIVITNPGIGYITAPTIAFSGGGGSSAAATATLSAQTATTGNFRMFIPKAASVISALTLQSSSKYNGDTAIIGKTLAADVPVPIWGTSMTLSSGWGILVRGRAN